MPLTENQNYSPMPKNRWHRYFHSLAHVVASNSQCLSRQVGAVLARDNIILATGYNGPPRRVPRCDQRFERDGSLERYLKKTIEPPPLESFAGACPRRALGFGPGEALHLCPSAHAEANAIVAAARNGVSVKDSVMYITCGVPCKNCLVLIINAGIRKVVCTSLERYDELTDYLTMHSELQIQTYI